MTSFARHGWGSGFPMFRDTPPRVIRGRLQDFIRDASPEQVCAELVQAGVGVRGFAVTSPSLEDLFVGLTGEGFDVSG